VAVAGRRAMGGDLTTDRDRSVIDCYGFRRLGAVRCPVVDGAQPLLRR
jgi:hypothetical protein